MNKKPPARNSLPVKKAPVGKVLVKQEKLILRSSVVAWARSSLRGPEDDDDDLILLLSDDDKAERKACNSSSSEGMVLTMLQDAESFFNLPWKDYISIYIVCVTCFNKIFLSHFCKCLLCLYPVF